MCICVCMCVPTYINTTKNLLILEPAIFFLAFFFHYSSAVFDYPEAPHQPTVNCFWLNYICSPVGVFVNSQATPACFHACINMVCFYLTLAMATMNNGSAPLAVYRKQRINYRLKKRLKYEKNRTVVYRWKVCRAFILIASKPIPETLSAD